MDAHTTHVELSRRQWLQAATAAGLTSALLPTIGSQAEAVEPSRPFDIWDNHCHFSKFEGRSPTEKMEHLIAYADRMQISRVVLFLGSARSHDPGPKELRTQNDEVLQAALFRPERTLSYAYVNPNHLNASLDEMRRCIRDGPMVGIKLWVAQRCNAANLDPIVRLATKLGAVVYQHSWIKSTGNLVGESTPADVVELAKRHPGAKLICGHSGGNWELGIRSIRPMANVLLETAGNDPTAGLLESAVNVLGADRIIYGSDAGGRSFASQLAKVTGADVTDAQKRQILAGNLRRLLAPILKSKA